MRVGGMGCRCLVVAHAQGNWCANCWMLWQGDFTGTFWSPPYPLHSIFPNRWHSLYTKQVDWTSNFGVNYLKLLKKTKNEKATLHFSLRHPAKTVPLLIGERKWRISRERERKKARGNANHPTPSPVRVILRAGSFESFVYFSFLFVKDFVLPPGLATGERRCRGQGRDRTSACGELGTAIGTNPLEVPLFSKFSGSCSGSS